MYKWGVSIVRSYRDRWSRENIARGNSLRPTNGSISGLIFFLPLFTFFLSRLFWLPQSVSFSSLILFLLYLSLISYSFGKFYTYMFIFFLFSYFLPRLNKSCVGFVFGFWLLKIFCFFALGQVTRNEYNFFKVYHSNVSLISKYSIFLL